MIRLLNKLLFGKPSGFNDCKKLKEGDSVTLFLKEKPFSHSKIITGVISYYDYGAKQLAINKNALVNFEDVEKVRKNI